MPEIRGMSGVRGLGCRADQHTCAVFFKTSGERDEHEKEVHDYHHVPIPVEVNRYGAMSHMGRSTLGAKFDRHKKEQW